VVPRWQFLGDLQLSCGDLPNLCGASVAILSLQLSCGDFPKLCTGSVTALKYPIVIGTSILVGGLEEITVNFGENSICKGVNFGIHHRLHVPRLFLYPSSFTYAIYFVIAIVLGVLYILLSHSCLSCLA
jgi:hypothetical protein